MVYKNTQGGGGEAFDFQPIVYIDCLHEFAREQLSD